MLKMHNTHLLLGDSQLPEDDLLDGLPEQNQTAIRHVD